MIAIDECATDMAKLFIDNGAVLDETDALGWTALHHAASFGNLEVAEKLIKYHHIH